MADRRKEVIARLLKEGVLISPDLLDKLDTLENVTSSDGVAVLNKDSLAAEQGTNLAELERSKARAEKNRDGGAYAAFTGSSEARQESCVRVLFSYDKPATKRKPKDFVAYFNKRQQQLERILKSRSELQGVVSIGRLALNGSKETVSLIGMVREKQITKNHNIVLVIEDQTGSVKVIITKHKPVVLEQAKDIVVDSVLGIVGVVADNAIFAQAILLPDVPLDKTLVKAEHPGYAAFISDIHLGSAQFLPQEFERFLTWINGGTGSAAQRELARQVQYLFIVGDIVDGVGIYPNQKTELAITDIYEQYRAAGKLLSRIPGHIQLIICPGNHDAVRLSEPQPAFTEEFCKPLRDALPHAIFVSNPSIVNIAATKSFAGLDVLLYHGYSFDYYVAEVNSIRQSGGYDRADLIMKFLLQHRHLAPSYGSTLYLPDPHKDNLVIERVPDIFVSGHIHKTSVSTYRNVTLICGSCWQGKTSFQEKMGHRPEPARVPLVNLQTRDVKVLKFG